MSKAILVVDDDEGYLLATQRLLEGAGYEVRTAMSAAAARATLTSARPDLILLDVIMPGKDGFAFIEELSKDKTTGDIPVVLVTSVAENAGHVLYALEEGKGLAAADILPKSEVHKRLIDVVASVLAPRQTAR